MATLSEMKAMSPAYAAMTDEEFADKVYQKHYAGKIDRAEFDKRTAPIDYVDETVGQASAGVNQAIDATINLPYNLIRGGAGLFGYDMPEAQPIVGQLNATGEPRTTVGQISRGIGEVAGASFLPQAGLLAKGVSMAPRAAQTGSAVSQAVKGMAQRAAANPAAFARNEAAAILGAGTGVGIAREADAGPLGEFAAGLLGGVAAPVAASGVSRTGSALKDAVGYGNNMVKRARDPQLAADQDVADAVVKSGAGMDALRREFSPKPGAQLKARGFNEEDMADIIARKAANEPSAKIAREYTNNGKQIAAGTIDDYVKRHRDMSPTPRNIGDAVTDMQGAGAARPVHRLGRAAVGLADDADTTQALIGRQEVQGGRVNTILSKAGGGRSYDDVVADLDDTLTTQARQAYKTAEQNAQPFNLRPAIRSGRDMAFKSAGSIRQGMEKAIDLFFEPVMGAAGKVRRLGQPISDMKRYQAAREALDDMIQKSFENNKPTRLTRKLTQFRTKINNVVRNANPDLAKADDLFSGAKTTENLLKQGGDISTRLGAKVETALKGFSKLKPEQKEVVRQGFLHRLANAADNPQDGRAIANQFQSEAVRKIVRKLFGPETIDKKLPKAEQAKIRKLNRDTQARGEALIKELKQEATTTRTAREFLSGSRTAEYAQDMNKAMQGAQAAADIATGRFGKILANLSDRLAYQIGEKQAKAIIETLTETEPARLLPILNRLARQAKDTKTRMQYVTAIREFKKELRRNSVSAPIGTAITAGSE